MLISVIIPAFGNEKALAQSLGTLEAQVRRHATECIVVDDGSKTPLTVPKWVKLLRIDRPPIHRGSSAAKNLGSRHAQGDALVFADSEILHLPDALMALRRTAQDWLDFDVSPLLNVMRVDLRQGFPISRTLSVEKLLRHCRGTSALNDENMLEPVITMEQNCGLIMHSMFDRVGGYDEVGFPNWGYNNQDLDLRVILAGGRLSSSIKRVRNNKRLYCFHPWHDASRSKWHAHQEFMAKWGEYYSSDLLRRVIKGTYERPVASTEQRCAV